MKEQLLRLQELQELDAKAHEIRQAMEALPQKLAPAIRDLARLEAMLDQERTQIGETEKWRTEQEELMRLEEDGLKKAKVKLQATKNARDFAAASREIDNKKRSISEREEEVLKIIEALDASRQTMEAHEKDVDALRQRVHAEQAEIDKSVAELRDKLELETVDRGSIADKVPKNVLKKYEQVREKRGIAVVPVKGGICQGCHMSLPPQLNNILARFESIETCPQCYRLLYRIELLGDGADDSQDN